jgi:hypothetical protein
MPLSVTFDRFEYSLLVRGSRLFCTTKRRKLVRIADTPSLP